MKNCFKQNNTIEMKNTMVLLVDDVNKFETFGYTESVEKINHIMNLIGELLEETEFESGLFKSKNGQTTLFPLGQYIVILKVNKDKSDIEMFFLSYEISYSDIENGFEGIFSKRIITEFKRIKYEMEGLFQESKVKVILST